MDFFYKLIEKLPGPGDNDKGELLGTAPKQARENCKENNVGLKKGWGAMDNKEQQCDKQKEMVLECKRRWSWYAQQATGVLRNIGKKILLLERNAFPNKFSGLFLRKIFPLLLLL